VVDPPPSNYEGGRSTPKQLLGDHPQNLLGVVDPPLGFGRAALGVVLTKIRFLVIYIYIYIYIQFTLSNNFFQFCFRFSKSSEHNFLKQIFSAFTLSNIVEYNTKKIEHPNKPKP